MNQLSGRLRIIFFFLLVHNYSNAHCQQDPVSDTLRIKTYGIKINVTDMEKALDFYSEKLGLEVESKEKYPQLVILKSNSTTKFILNLVSNLVGEKPTDSKASLTFRVNNLDTAIMNLNAKGMSISKDAKQKEGVGYSLRFSDPFGTNLFFIEIVGARSRLTKEPQIYNYGITIADMDKSRQFFKMLGFTELNEKFLPLDMALMNADKTFAFMLHFREGTETIRYHSTNDEHIVILFKTADLAKSISQMKQLGVEFIQSKIQETNLGKFISFRDKSGQAYELVEAK